MGLVVSGSSSSGKSSLNALPIGAIKIVTVAMGVAVGLVDSRDRFVGGRTQLWTVVA